MILLIFHVFCYSNAVVKIAWAWLSMAIYKETYLGYEFVNLGSCVFFSIFLFLFVTNKFSVSL